MNRPKQLSGFFENYMKKDPLFMNKKALQGNYTPETIPHRDEQVQQIAGILAPALRMEKPSNIFLYGRTGTGKTVVSQYVADQLMKTARKKNISLEIMYLNCKMKKVADTEYRMMAQLANNFGAKVPATGLPTDEVYRLFLEKIDEEDKIVVLILDEIDQLVSKTGDGILYNLTRINSELKKAEISFIGISNDLVFADNLDPRVKSSLSEEELVFPPYNALQLQDILKERVELAFKKGVIEEGVIEKCAAYAAREHGDARRALELIRVAGEIAERKNKNKVNVGNLDEAEEKIERDRIVDMVKTQPKQGQIVLYSIFNLDPEDKVFTGDAYGVYKDNCKLCGLKPLTQRRVSDIIAELDMLGIINARVISKGRYGRTREISLAIPDSSIEELKKNLEGSLGI
ncbi:ORC1-type DNA replication protein [Candidatus Woesearchaeota archaeon]|nr:ORC1-type DNA replication protein [Candidatus Woesearchaeota archaeon]